MTEATIQRGVLVLLVGLLALVDCRQAGLL